MLPKNLQPTGPIDPRDVTKPADGQPLLVQVDFEVIGDTQGKKEKFQTLSVPPFFSLFFLSLFSLFSFFLSLSPGTYFLKYARDTAERLGLRGWVKLSHRSTVIGQIQGEKERIDEM